MKTHFYFYWLRLQRIKNWQDSKKSASAIFQIFYPGQTGRFQVGLFCIAWLISGIGGGL